MSEPSGDLSPRQIRWVFYGVLLGMVLAALDQTIVATALPTIVADLGDVDHLSWVVTAYLLTATVSAPLYGKLGDLYGRKRLFQVAICVFLAGSMSCGLATSMPALIVFRAAQGLGAGGLIVLAQAILADVVSPRERGRYAGLFGAFFGASSVAGPLLGGFLTDHLSWRWVFYVNLPVGLLALIVVRAVLPASPRRRYVSIDYLGAGLLVTAITCVVLMTTWGGNEYDWASPTIVGLAAASIGATVAFLVAERRAREPILPLELFRVRTFNLFSGISMLNGAAMLAVGSFFPLFLQTVNGESATSSGLLLAPMMVGLMVSSIAVGRVVSRTGRWRVYPIAGSLIAMCGFGLLALLSNDTGRLQSAFDMAVIGLGFGLVGQISVLATQSEVPAAHLGTATSAVNLFRSVGQSVGVAIFGALFTAKLAGEALDPTAVRQLPDGAREAYTSHFADAFAGTFAYGAVLLAVAVVLAVLVHERPLRDRVHARADVEALVPEPA